MSSKKGETQKKSAQKKSAAYPHQQAKAGGLWDNDSPSWPASQMVPRKVPIKGVKKRKKGGDLRKHRTTLTIKKRKGRKRALQARDRGPFCRSERTRRNETWGIEGDIVVEPKPLGMRRDNTKPQAQTRKRRGPTRGKKQGSKGDNHMQKGPREFAQTTKKKTKGGRSRLGLMWGCSL